MGNSCTPIQEILSVYDIGFEENSKVCRVLNHSLTGVTMSTSTFLALTGGTDYDYVLPTALSEGDLVLGAIGDNQTIQNFCGGEAVTSGWDYKIYTVKNISCLYSNKANIVNSQWIFIPNQDVYYYDGASYKWKDAYNIKSTDLLLDISGNTVSVSGVTLDICTDRLYWNIQVEERTNKRVALFNGSTKLILSSCDNQVPVVIPMTPIPSVTPTISLTPTNTSTMTPTPTPTVTKTPAFTPTVTPSVTPTKTIGASSTPTPTISPSISVTPSTSKTTACNFCQQYAIFNGSQTTQSVDYIDCDGNLQSTNVDSNTNLLVCTCDSTVPTGNTVSKTFAGLCGDPTGVDLIIAKDVKLDAVNVVVNGTSYLCDVTSDGCTVAGILTIGTPYNIQVFVTPYNRPDAVITVNDANGQAGFCVCLTLNDVTAIAGVTGITVYVGI
jgi:hypothetical protein